MLVTICQIPQGAMRGAPALVKDVPGHQQHMYWMASQHTSSQGPLYAKKS